MKKLISYFVLLFVLILCVSCEKIVQVKLPDQNPKIVINATISTDSIIAVHVSKSVGALENRPKTVLYHALVKLYEDDVFIEDLKLNAQNFFTSPTNFKPKVGKTYKIEASLKNYETATATCKIPEITSPSQITYIDSAFTSTSSFDVSYKEWYSQIDITINDDAQTKNYYAIQVLQEYPIYSEEVDTLNDIVNLTIIGYQKIPLTIETKDPNAEIKALNCILSDDYFNGNTYKITLNLPSSSFLTDSLTHYYLYFKSITKETYLYNKTLLKYGNSIGNPFAEPVRVYSNVEKGMGIFEGYSSSLKKIK